MHKNFNISRIFCHIAVLMLISVLIIACGNQTESNTGKQASPTAAAQGNLITSKLVNIDLVTPTATAEAMATATPEIQATATPITITVSWNTSPETVYTVGMANIRSIPYTSGAITQTVAASQAIQVYGTVSGEILGNGGTWYRTSDQNSAPEYIYSALVNNSKPVVVDAGSDNSGKVIKVNLTTQHIYAYNNGAIVHDALITSGQPNLLTPTGTFTIISKLHPTTFYSPWPKDSPYYYAPLQINYALGFQGTLLFLHDAYWRGNDFGPGTNVPHTVAGKVMTGSHGCVEMSTADSAWFYDWAPIGTPLIIAY